MTAVKENKKNLTKLQNKPSVFKVVFFVFMLIWSVALLSMYIWGFFTSLKTKADFMNNIFGLPSGMPWKWKWGNYASVFNSITVTISPYKTAMLPEMIFNSILYSGMSSLFSVFTTWAVAYLLAKFDYRFSRWIYTFNIILMMVPIYGSLPSALQIYKAIKLYDTWGFVVVNSIGFIGTNLLIFYAFFKGIGRDIIEAAEIDGAGNITSMLKVVFPITSQMFFILVLMSFIASWNDYMTMLIWLPSKPTLAFGIYKFSTSVETANAWPNIQIAACMLLMIPILLIYLAFQDALIGNIRMGALK